MVLRDPAGRLGGRGRPGPRGPGPRRLPPLAPARYAAPVGVARLPAPGAGSRRRRRRQRCHPLDRHRFAHLPARRAGQVRPPGVGRRPAGAPGGVHAQLPSHAAPRRRRAGGHGDPAHAPAQPRHHHRAGRNRADPVLRRRGAARAPGGVDDARHQRRHRARPRRALPPQPGPHVPRSLGRPHRQGLPEHPGPGGRGLGRLLRTRARRQPRQVGVPALRPHRLHLRHHRRGTGPGRRRRGRGVVRAAGDHRCPGGAARARPLRPIARDGRDRLVRRAGLRQHRCRDRHPSHHRGPAPVRECRRLVAPVHDGRRWPAALGRAPGAGDEPAARAPASGRR